MGEPRAGFAYLEHTADVGIRAWGASLPEAFEQAGLGLAALMGATAPPPGRAAPIHVEGVDPGGLLVAFLDDLVFRCELGAGVAGLRVTHLGPASLDAIVDLAEAPEAGEGLVVKAATFHQLAVEEADGGAEVRVFLDV
jgi:SHS2 domain-containing protein